jgi:hypothetical protein
MKSLLDVRPWPREVSFLETFLEQENIQEIQNTLSGCLKRCLFLNPKIIFMPFSTYLLLNPL